MGTPETSREPCPDCILDDSSGAFAMGAVGGTMYHYIKGAINAPKGERMLGGFQRVSLSVPRNGGSFAMWGALFSSFDCASVYIRQKEDPWNSIIAGAATGATLSLRRSLRASARSAAFGGVLLGLIEGANIMMNRVLSPSTKIMHADPSMAGGGGGGKKEGSGLSGGCSDDEVMVLESFDMPTPMPTFDFR